MSYSAGIFSTDDPAADRRQIEAESADDDFGHDCCPECGDTSDFGRCSCYCPICHQWDEACICSSDDDSGKP